jgi:transposase
VTGYEALSPAELPGLLVERDQVIAGLREAAAARDEAARRRRSRRLWTVRAYLLKEGIRSTIFQLEGQPEAARQALGKWLAWAARCRIPQFVKLGQKIRGLLESVNTKIRVITRMAFGFHSPPALIALAMLTLGGYRPALPGR